jgi:hypothetical protein
MPPRIAMNYKHAEKVTLESAGIYIQTSKTYQNKLLIVIKSLMGKIEVPSKFV